MARLKNSGIFTVLEFPLLREGDGTELERCTWKAKYPRQEAIDPKRQELGDVGFGREMLLKVVREEGQDVLPEDNRTIKISASIVTTCRSTSPTLDIDSPCFLFDF